MKSKDAASLGFITGVVIILIFIYLLHGAEIIKLIQHGIQER
jgi:hypothetical protein